MSSSRAQPYLGAVLCQLEILGRIYSNKNSQRLVVKNGRVLNIGNKQYRATRNNYSEQLQRQLESASLPKRFPGAVSLELDVWVPNESWYSEWRRGSIPTKYAGNDTDNRTSAIFDILQYAGILADDCQIVSHHTTKHYGKRPGLSDYGAVITMREFIPNGEHDA